MNSAIRHGLRPLLGIAAFVAGTAAADDYHYVNMLIGDRASGLGGAYTAVSDDATGMFYNPAGIAYTHGRSLSASVNAYHITHTSYKSVLGGGDWNRESSSLLPNFFGVVQPLGPGVAGLSYAVTDSIQESLSQHFADIPATATTNAIDDYIINVNNSDAIYKFGPSYAFEISPTWSVGITLYAHVRSTETIMNQVISGINGTGYEHTIHFARSDEWGFEPILGVMWNPADKLALGASVRQTSIVGSSFRNQATCVTNINVTPGQHDVCHVDATGVGYTEPHSEITKTSAKRVYPLQVAVGAAYFPSERLLMTGDFTYYSAVDGPVSKRVDSPFRGKEAIWNASVGAEYYVSGTWALRGGLFTSNANTPELASGGANQPEHVNLTGLSASVSHFNRSSSITAGFSYVAGTGLAQVVSGTADRQDVASNTATFFLSTSYNY